jgi:hypothetical protein
MRENALVVFFVVGGALALGALLAYGLTRQVNVPDNPVLIETNLCGVPDAWCNITNVPPAPQYCPYLTQQPKRVIFVTRFNSSICPIKTNFFSLSAYLNLTNYIPSGIPDNVTAAATTCFVQRVRSAIPGASTTFVNVTYPPAYAIISVSAQLTNLTLLESEAVFQALQYCSYLIFWNLPVTITSFNATDTSALPTPRVPVCSVNSLSPGGNQTCALANTTPTQFCANWNNNAICICNFPQTVRQTNTENCVPNPCYSTSPNGANGGCLQTQSCFVNFNAASNRTCV